MQIIRMFPVLNSVLEHVAASRLQYALRATHTWYYPQHARAKCPPVVFVRIHAQYVPIHICIRYNLGFFVLVSRPGSTVQMVRLPRPAH